MLRTFSEICENSVLTPRQNSVNRFLTKFKSSMQMAHILINKAIYQKYNKNAHECDASLLRKTLKVLFHKL